MASFQGSSGGTSELPKSKTVSVLDKVDTKLSRRQLTLIIISVLLHVLLWTSVIALIISIFLIVADPGDGTYILTEILTITSAVVSIAYISLHATFSWKQRIWEYQQQDLSIVKKTSYVAVRLAVTLCILWLLTTGWNMITSARRPVCLPAGAGLEGWEAGSTCVVGRIGTAISMIALIASCTLFYMLAVVRRPFEAHLLNHKHRQPVDPYPIPTVTRCTSSVSENYRGCLSVSSRRSILSYNTDIETLDLDGTSPPSTIHAPSPIRPTEFGLFTSPAQLPSPTLAFIRPHRTDSIDTLPQVFYPSLSSPHLPLPLRTSAVRATSGLVPLAYPREYSASVWRAVHPNLPIPSPVHHTPVASRSTPHLRQSSSISLSHYRSGYARSSVSLTRPHLLSSATLPVPTGSLGCSSCSGSTGPEDDRQTRSSGTRSGPGSGTGSASTGTNDHSCADPRMLVDRNTISCKEIPRGKRFGHVRHNSAPTTTGPQLSSPYSFRKAKVWKPQLQGQEEALERGNSIKVTPARSSATELLGKYTPETSLPDSTVDLCEPFETVLDAVWTSAGSENPVQHATVEKAKSANLLRSSPV